METNSICLLSILVGILTFYAYKRWRTWRSRPPGLWGFPIIGNLTWLDQKAPHVSLTKLAQKFGPIYGLYLGNIYTVVLSDPKTIKKVFSKDAACGRAPLYLTHGIMKGCGIICAQGDLWKDQRKFVHNSLRILGASKVSNERTNFEKLISQHANDFVQFVKSKGTVATLNPLNSLRHSLGSVINLLVFGRCWAEDDETWVILQHLQEQGTKYIGVAGAVNFLPFLRFLPSQTETLDFLLDGIEFTHMFYKKIISDDIENPDGRLSLLRLFHKERDKRRQSGDDTADKFYNDQQYHYLLADIFGASLDTTLTSLRWYLLLMSVHPEAQRLVRDELGTTDEINFDELSSFPYTEATIAESQRIRTVVPTGIPHGTLEEMDIEGYKVPKGAMLLPLQWAVHMNPDFWDDPDAFKPERFINEEGKFCKPEAFIPFQSGKRMCVGDDLAKMYLFVYVTTILRHFEISCENPDLDGETGITLTPKDHELVFKTLSN